MYRHLRRVHDDLFRDYKKFVERPTAAREEGQSTLTSYVSTSSNTSYGPASLRQKSLTTSLVTKLIVQCALPISLVDHSAFRSFLADLDPKFTPPVRQTVTYSILPQLYQSQQSKLTAILEKCTDISLTTDIWTDRRMHSFLGVTAHAFIDGNPESYLLAFRAFSGSHTGQRIAESLESVITDHNIQHEIRSVVTDNASNMKKALSVILSPGELSVTVEGNVDDASLWEDDPDTTSVDGLASLECEHIPCFAHSLQLVIHDGLASLNMARNLLAKCCKLANLLHQSSLFRSYYEEMMGKGKIIPSSNETRWNSTFTSLKLFRLLIK